MVVWEEREDEFSSRLTLDRCEKVDYVAMNCILL